MTLASRPRADLLAEAQAEEARRKAQAKPFREWQERPRVILRQAAKPGEGNMYGYAVVRNGKR